MTKKVRARLAHMLAPGVGKVRQFSVRLVMDSNDSFKVDWDSFKKSTQVKEQMDAAASSRKLQLKHG